MDKQFLTMRAFAGIFMAVAGFWCGLSASVRADELTIVNAFVTDPLSGVALGGFDPVSYFTEDTPKPGNETFAYEWGGVPWYFVNAANRDVFERAPEIYAPLFGGYGVMGLSRGYLTEGNPHIYRIEAGRLMLFHSTGNREAFGLSPRQAYEQAAANWPELSKDLTHATPPAPANGESEDPPPDPLAIPGIDAPAGAPETPVPSLPETGVDAPSSAHGTETPASSGHGGEAAQPPAPEKPAAAAHPPKPSGGH